jgi:hypothetical protein
MLSPRRTLLRALRVRVMVRVLGSGSAAYDTVVHEPSLLLCLQSENSS